MKPVSFRAGASRPLFKRALVAAAGAVALLPASRTFASITFAQGSSEATLKHDPDRDSTLVSPKIIELDDIPASSSMPAYHISKMFTSGSASTQSFGSIGHVTNSTTASFVLKPGTGVSQNDPTNAFPGASSLKLNIDTVWNVGSGGFGPLATGFISLGVGGVVGDGGYSKVQADLSFTDPTTGATLRS